MANQKKKSKKLSPITWILIGVLAVMALLITFMTVSVSKITSRNAETNMQTVAAERAKVIADYVDWAEGTLRDFSYADDIKNLLLHPNDSEALAQAQRYTESFASEIDDLEGLYICDWDAKTLTHSNTDTIGKVIREGDRLYNLRIALVAAGNDIYNDGILISPSTDKQVVAIYKGIFDDNNEPIGFVGLAILTENTLSDLADMQISGLEDAGYLLVNTEDNVYLYTDDPDSIGKVCDVEDVQKINANLIDGKIDNSGIGEYINIITGKKTLSAHVYLDDYKWTLFFNAPASDVYAMRNQLQIFILIFGILIILLVAVFGIINAHQEAVNRRLGLQLKKNEATEESLQTAMFKDILTEVQNRVAFSEDIETIQTDGDHPCFFVMFDISELAVINMQFGNDAGDTVLCNTADALKEAFPDGKIYRTGDDEFVVAVRKDDNSPAAYNQVLRQITRAQSELLKKQEIPDGTISVGYKIAIVRATTDLSTTVVAILKDLANRNGRSPLGQFSFLDLDTL